MVHAHDTALRYLALLQLLPVYPRTRSTQDIAERLLLRSAEFAVSRRTLQRDLDKLSTLFPISCDVVGRRYDWYWTDRHALTQIPDMNTASALALRLAEENLTNLLPATTLKDLSVYFARAKQVLNETKLGRWSHKIHLISNTSPLRPAIIKPAIQSTVYEALLEGRQLQIHYHARHRETPRTYVLQPFGMVIREGVFYLVAGSAEYDEPNHYCLHRMQSARVLPEVVRIPKSFNLKTYVEEEMAFAYPQSQKRIRLKALFAEETGFHLQESALSDDQCLNQQEDGRWLIRATVDDTAKLRWWLLGFGANVEILKPKSLRREFDDTAKRLAQLYHTPSPH